MPPNTRQPAIVGVGASKSGKFPDATDVSLAVGALHGALADAGLSMSSLDGIITSKVNYETLLAETGAQPTWLGLVSPHGRMCGVAIQQAVAAIDAGRATTIALVYGSGGASNAAAPGTGGEGYGSWPELSLPSGMTSPGAFYALMRQRHGYLYGTTDEQLAAIPLSFREHARRTPGAIMQSDLTLEDYLTSRFIVEPLRLYDYCLVNDGAVALILTAGDRADDFPSPPVRVLGAAHRADFHNFDFPPEDFWAESMRGVADRAFAEADRSRNDLDALMVYDNFSCNVLFALEGLGICPVGESGAYVASGALRPGGALPINTSGGHLSGSNLQGWGLNAEAVLQLRGTAGDRQVAGAKTVAFACASPVVSTVVYGIDS